jgi:thioredoxin reductase (NADPH)
VHYCALCDGPLYKGKILGVAGGSDSAVKEALQLTDYAKKVYIIYRKDTLRAEPINMERLKKNDKVEAIYNTNVKEIKGEKFVNKVILDKEYNGSKELALDGLFIEIGHIPQTKMAEKIGVKVNDKKEIILDRHGNTNVKGVFACGDLVDSSFKQAITGAAEGVIAAYNAYTCINKGCKIEHYDAN